MSLQREYFQNLNLWKLLWIYVISSSFIFHLSQVEVKSGEEDEEILFKERAKLYRWDRDVSQWKERGVGDIKILWHTLKNYYRILMRRDQVFKVCANHVITKTMELKPLNVSNNALVWTASDYAGMFKCYL